MKHLTKTFITLLFVCLSTKAFAIYSTYLIKAKFVLKNGTSITGNFVAYQDSPENMGLDSLPQFFTDKGVQKYLNYKKKLDVYQHIYKPTFNGDLAEYPFGYCNQNEYKLIRAEEVKYTVFVAEVEPVIAELLVVNDTAFADLQTNKIAAVYADTDPNSGETYYFFSTDTNLSWQKIKNHLNTLHPNYFVYYQRTTKPKPVQMRTQNDLNKKRIYLILELSGG